jgi:hypothetical protein
VVRHLLTPPRSYALVGATALAALIFLLPLVGTTELLPPGAQIVTYALSLIPVCLLLHGFLVAASSYATPRLLALGAVCAAFGLFSALLARPENFESASGFPILLVLCIADVSRILAAACVGISLARYITSIGTALIVAATAIAADIFSVFAGPTRVLMQQDSPALDVLLLIFPTFGSALGFGLGVSDIVFLALFVAVSCFLELRYVATLLGVSSAVFVAVTTGLLLERPLPALPFVAIAFVLVNTDLIVKRIAKRR